MGENDLKLNVTVHLGNVTVHPDTDSQHTDRLAGTDIQKRWNQHYNRMLRGKRLTGGGQEIDDEHAR